MDGQILAKITACIFSGDLAEMEADTRAALAAGNTPVSIIEQGLIPGMEKLGQAFAKGEAFLPELLIGAEAMNTSLALIKPLLKSEDRRARGTVIIGTVLGDVHDIGKNIVAWMLEGAGFNVIDLGVDVPPERFVEGVQQHAPDIVALSALLTTSSHQIAKVVRRLAERGLRDKVKVLAGGASISAEYAEQAGADGYALDAVGAVAKARELNRESARANTR
jgi:5-methyltetrahydrofolate--homocysteine methyltransferase